MKITRAQNFLAIALVGVLAFTSARAQDIQPGQKIDPTALQWPRFYATNGYEFAIYQPQINSWAGNELDGRLVVAVRHAGTTNESYGVVYFTSRTDIDKVNRLVTLENVTITKAKFPSQPEMKAQYLAMIQSFQPHTVRVIPLDHLEAVFAASADITQAKVQSVKNDPPRIIFATQPSLLVLVDGPPILNNLIASYQRVANTRAILLWDNDPQYQSFFLYADNQWFSAPALAGPWAVASNFPTDIDDALSSAFATKQVDPMYPKDPSLPAVSQIFVSTVPAELIETAGPPNLVSISGTDLLYVQNSSSAVFSYQDDGNFYVLISGRWFKAASLDGPWAFVPPGSLPGDFKKIPADSEKSNVMLSVAGTPQAQEAVIANSIPQTATVQRDQAALAVDYAGGQPNFTPIDGTPLSYAANTATPVIMVGPNSYYACQAGLWFTAPTALGPWAVATAVPPVIYSIPASCPIHYVTYAYVYGYTPTTVYVGYTPGYMGTVVAPGGVVVYGTGYYYPPAVVGAVYVGYPPTYGYGASFALGPAVGYSFGYCAGMSSSCCCEPYWGCYSYGYASAYSYTHCNVNACNYYSHYGTAVQATGSYGYNAYTGNEWASHSAATFNPYTGTQRTVNGSAAYNPYSGNASATRSGSAYNPATGASASGSSSVSGNAYNGNYDASRQGSYNNTTTGESASGQKSVSGNVQNGTASVSGSGSAQNSKTGNSASWSNGSMTSDKDGNTYAYNEGQTSQNKSTAQSESGRESSAETTGTQRFNSFSNGGGGGWGGAHVAGRR